MKFYLKIPLLLLLIMASFSGSCQSKNNRKNQIKISNKFDETFQPGQIWKYKNRKGEDTSRVTILKVDEIQGKEIVIHVSVSGLKISPPDSNGSTTESIGHLPMSKTSLEQSLTELISENNPLPDYEEGYQRWRTEAEKGKAGFFTISVAEAINFVEQVIQKH